MLDVLRKHASSWLIKIILGAITISFIFFFGYSSMRKAGRVGKLGDISTVASVNGQPIPTTEYSFFLDRNYERMRSSFEGKEVPAFAKKMAESATLQQLVARELMMQQADALGIVIPDIKLADVIRKTPAATQDGEFDPIYYKHEFLPYFNNRFGMDYENLILADLKAEALESIFTNVDQNIGQKDAAANKGNGSWTFEVIVFDPKAMVSSKVIKSEDEARQAAAMLIKADSKNWNGMLSPLKISSKKVGPISIKERSSILNGQGTFEDHQKIFMLTKEHSILAEPIERSGKLYVIRLVDMVKPEKADSNFWPTNDFYRTWMGKLSDKAKIVSYIKEEK